ncbi:MAG: xanthine dehydrogenase family protein subunit M [Clostridiaceae bacterium]
MFTMTNLVQPDTVEEAYKILMEKKNNTILGGCAFLRMGSKRIDTGIELSKLNLNYISEDENHIEIGAYATLRDLERNPLLNKYYCGVIPASIRDIIGVQLRSIVTAGASVYSKYGFSDLIPVLLVLDCEVELFKGGRVKLSEFMDKPYEKDILTRLYLKKSDTKAAYANLRNSVSDYSVLNAAVSKSGSEFIIAVGARPAKSKIAKEASQYLSGSSLDNESVEKAAVLVSEEIGFGSNMRGSEDYRKAICGVLVRKAVKEVLECR